MKRVTQIHLAVAARHREQLAKGFAEGAEPSMRSRLSRRIREDRATFGATEYRRLYRRMYGPLLPL